MDTRESLQVELGEITLELPDDILKAVVQLVRYLNSPLPHSGTAHKNRYFGSVKEEKVDAKPKRTPGEALPEDPEELEILREAVINESFMKWYEGKGYSYDLDTEWLRFTNNWIINKRRFTGKTLQGSVYRGFQNWLLSPYAKNSANHGAVTKRSTIELSASLTLKVQIAQGLKDTALDESKDKDAAHWYKIWTNYLDKAGIELKMVRPYIK